MFRVLLVYAVCAAFAAGGANQDTPSLKEQVKAKYGALGAKYWGTAVPGMKTAFAAADKAVALTLDACDGAYDERLIEVLRNNRVPATLFVSGLWLQRHSATLRELAGDPLFEIENHGDLHRPLSISGKAVFGLRGTQNIDEVVDEIEIQAERIWQITGRRPIFFRPAGGYADDVAVRAANDLGHEVVSFTVSGDGGTRFSKQRIVATLSSVTPGSIIVCHMNHPDRATAEGLEEALPRLIDQGYRFVKLDEVRPSLTNCAVLQMAGSAI